jgi:hypothetical protein
VIAAQSRAHSSTTIVVFIVIIIIIFIIQSLHSDSGSITVLQPSSRAQHCSPLIYSSRSRLVQSLHCNSCDHPERYHHLKNGGHRVSQLGQPTAHPCPPSKDPGMVLWTHACSNDPRKSSRSPDNVHQSRESRLGGLLSNRSSIIVSDLRKSSRSPINQPCESGLGGLLSTLTP